MSPRLIRAVCVAKAKICSGAILSLILLGGVGCEQRSVRTTLDVIKARGELRVLTRSDATSYTAEPHNPAGFEYELAQAFANHLGVKLRPVFAHSVRDMVPALLRGEADIIAAGLAITKTLSSHLAFGPPYMEVTMEVVGRRGGYAPRAVADLVGQPLWVHAGTVEEELLKEQKARYPQLSWRPVSEYETEDLLGMVCKGTIPLTVANSNIVAMQQRYYPHLVTHFPISEREPLAWAMNPRASQLRAAVENWFNRPETMALIEQLRQHHYAHLSRFDFTDVVTYHRRLRERLPEYRKYFEAAGGRYGIDWRLVAALAYQESHWHPEAESFTGVKGLMMLTRKTAADLGVMRRLDPDESVFAGARYFAHLHRRIGVGVSEPDRTYMALAAYNVGWSHLEDARLLARRLGKNPNAWPAVRSTLPLLGKREFYQTLPHGFARGAEPVRFVDCIRTYHSILVQATNALLVQREKGADGGDNADDTSMGKKWGMSVVL
ncbi:MAG TPA: membrane-bound lytic murein transglycosylase MltF [Syntrophobacteria bacterium]|nr:membrane-bound lytic murein transglycosylase MltF [Syntrophobacteria bacterium]